MAAKPLRPAPIMIKLVDRILGPALTVMPIRCLAGSELQVGAVRIDKSNNRKTVQPKEVS